MFPEGENVPEDWVEMIANGDRERAQDYREKYVHKLGNLTVTCYNSKLSNMSFERKRDRKDENGKYVGYRNGLEINKEIAEKDSWTINDIKERTEKLTKELLEMHRL